MKPAHFAATDTAHNNSVSMKTHKNTDLIYARAKIASKWLYWPAYWIAYILASAAVALAVVLVPWKAIPFMRKFRSESQRLREFDETNPPSPKGS